jgi:hypothetical protein
MSESDGNSNMAPVEDEKMEVDADEDVKKSYLPAKMKSIKDEDDEDESEDEKDETEEKDEKDGDYRDEGK